MTAAPIKPLVADRDARFLLEVRVRDDDDVPRDFTGHAVSLVLLARSQATDVIASYDGTGHSNGWLVVEVEDTTTWPTGRIAYRLTATDDTDDTGTDFVLVGPLTVKTPADV